MHVCLLQSPGGTTPCGKCRSSGSLPHHRGAPALRKCTPSGVVHDKLDLASTTPWIHDCALIQPTCMLPLQRAAWLPFTLGPFFFSFLAKALVFAQLQDALLELRVQPDQVPDANRSSWTMVRTKSSGSVVPNLGPLPAVQGADEHTGSRYLSQRWVLGGNSPKLAHRSSPLQLLYTALFPYYQLIIAICK